MSHKTLEGERVFRSAVKPRLPGPSFPVGDTRYATTDTGPGGAPGGQMPPTDGEGAVRQHKKLAGDPAPSSIPYEHSKGY